MIKNSKIIEKKVFEKINPSQNEKEKIKETTSQLIIKIEKEIKKYDIDLSIELVGSIAKGTYLKNNLDIDIFILFPTEISRKKLQNIGLSIGKAVLKNQEECFAEHPYIRGTFKGLKAEIVPCYKIKSASQKLSAVDRTPLHTEYVKKHLAQKQKKEVMLFKQFLRGIGCYGAEAEIEGFSGYLCEILIIKYSNFHSIIEHALHWQYGQKINLKKKKSPDFFTPLIFIDPVDSQRNVASALSEAKFDLFKKACIEYTREPRLTFFFPNDIKPWSLDRISKKLEEIQVIAIRIKKPSIISENLYPQIRKAIRSIESLCGQNDFLILDSQFLLKNTYIYMIFFPESLRITKNKKHMGPPIKMKKNAKEFLNRWQKNQRTIKGPYEKNKRLFVEIKREYFQIDQLIKEQIINLSLGKHIDNIVKKNFSLLKKKKLLIEPLRVFWTNYLDEKMSWER